MAQRAKVAMAIVYPAAVRREGIVAHVNIREPVAIDIAEHYRQPLVPRRSGQRFAILVQKGAVGPRNRLETPPAIIEVKRIRFSQLVHDAVDDFDALPVTTAHNGLAVD